MSMHPFVRRGGPRLRLPSSSFLLALAVTLAAFLADLPAAQAQSVPEETPEFLRPGDLVRVEVWREAEFSGEYRVTPDGRIAHPLYRRIEVEGREVEEVEADLRAFLSDFESNPEFVVEGLFRVAVGGEVRQPDVHSLPPGTTVAEAVAMAGGISEDGALDDVLLRREGVEYRIDLTDPDAGVRGVTIRSGDEIVVERDRNLLRDYVVPGASIVAAAASVLRVIY